MTTSDETLALAAADGDRAAFASLLERHYDRLYGLAVKLLGNAADAEDVIQDICAALPAKLGSFRGDARFSTWSYRVVVNAVHDFRRRRQSRAKAAAGWGDWAKAQKAEADEAKEAQDWLMTAMAQLPEDLRDTLVLIFDDCTQADCARILDLSEGTIAWRVSEAKKHLRALAESEAT